MHADLETLNGMLIASILLPAELGTRALILAR
jgi:hypothetical protein